MACYKFQQSVGNKTPSTETHIVSHDDFLYSLGLILIELWFEKPGKAIDAGWPNISVPNMKNYTGRIKDDAGTMYMEAVKSCMWGINAQETNGDFNEAYQVEV
jgi:hypothetical protein